jgi:hypothetical protein
MNGLNPFPLEIRVLPSHHADIDGGGVSAVFACVGVSVKTRIAGMNGLNPFLLEIRVLPSHHADIDGGGVSAVFACGEM